MLATKTKLFFFHFTGQVDLKNFREFERVFGFEVRNSRRGFSFQIEVSEMKKLVLTFAQSLEFHSAKNISCETFYSLRSYGSENFGRVEKGPGL